MQTENIINVGIVIATIIAIKLSTMQTELIIDVGIVIASIIALVINATSGSGSAAHSADRFAPC